MKIVSLGSSFAAGPGLHPLSNVPAGRSAINYASLLAKKLNAAEHVDLTVSWATLLNVLKEPQEVLGGTVFPPQIEGLPADADIVTLTGGGNDLGYIGDVVKDELKSTYIGQLTSMLYHVRDIVPTTEDELVARFVAVIDAVHAKAPKAKIYLLEYLTLFGDDIRPHWDVTMNQERIAAHSKVSDTLNRAYARAVEQRKDIATLIPIGKESWNHGLGSDEPWVDGMSIKMLFNKRAPFHPNEAGMRGIADIAIKYINV